MRIAALTPTRDRPLAFNLCEKWIARQTVKLDLWVVVDDGDIPVETSIGIHIRSKPSKKRVTLLENFLLGMREIKRFDPDVFLYMEDDDWRGPGYIADCIAALEECDVATLVEYDAYHVGYRVFGRAIRGHVDSELIPAGSRNFNFRILSMNIAARRSAIKKLVKSAERALGSRYPSEAQRATSWATKFWSMAQSKLSVRFFKSDNFLSLKGIPGRHVTGHHTDVRKIGRNSDPKGRWLRDHVGAEDAADILSTACNGSL